MKLKRLFTAVLSTALALSLCAMPAMAADSAAATMPKTSTSTIDKNQKGSITIYKRALDSIGNAGTAGDGETMASPQGAALKDTGFTLYQVMNTEKLLAYYNDAATDKQVEVADYFTDYTTNKTAAGLKTAYATAYKSEVRTDENGKATFTELPVGMYLVIETKTSQAVTVPVEPFLVSIPMTRIGDKATGADNQNQKEWLYDVTVYPKNSIAKGNVTLVKQGKQGSATTPLAGVKFTLNRKNDTDDDYTAVKTDVATDTNGKITLDNLTKGRYYLQETGYTDGNDKGYILNTTGKFYFDIDENGKAVKVDDTIAGKVDDASFAIDGRNTLTVTNYKPDIVKTVTKRDGTANTHEADYGVGDAVPYTLAIKVPENITSLKTFKVTDTTVKAQLIQNKDSVKINGKKNAGGDVTLAKSTYTITVAPDADNSVMTVDFFKPSELADVAGGKITITYTATVQSGAIVAGDGNVNTAKIVYSRKTGIEAVPGDQTYEITDKGVVYTFGLKIHKTAKGGKENGNGLKEVTFDLYKMVESYELEGGQVKTTIRGVDYTDENLADAVKLGLTENKNEKWIKIETLKTGDGGYVSAKGLPSGTYKLVETKTADGYNLLSKPVDAKLNLTYSEAWTTTTKYDEKGNQTKSTITTPTYTRGEEKVTDPSAEIEIVNRAGFTLPVTGGFGTLLFSGIGVLLVLAGVGVLFSLKKKSNRA